MFGKRITLFRLLGFEVRFDWSWIIIAVLVTWTLAQGLFPFYFRGLSNAMHWWMGVAGAAGLFLSIIIHELGHAITARRFGINMRGITLFIFGGVAEMEGEPRSPKSEFSMAIAGPITSLILAVVFYLFTRLAVAASGPVPIIGVLGYLAWINLVLAVFNLVPAFPLDGGRVLRSMLWAWKDNLRWATRVSAAIGSGFGVLLMIWGIFSFIYGNFIGGMWWFLIGIFIRGASQMSYQQLLLRQSLEGEPVRRFMNPNPVAVPPSISLRQLVQDYIYKYHFKTFPVVEDGNLKGCVNLDQIKQVPPEEWDRRTVESLASSCPPESSISPDADAVNALSTMSRNNLGRLMVVDHGHLVGMIALKDLLDLFRLKLELEKA